MSSVPPSVVSNRPLAVYGPRGECLHVGSIPAASDAEGLQKVLESPPAGLKLDPSKHYRVRVGSSVASSAGDEFGKTAGASQMPVDGAGVDAAREVRRVREEAERGLKEFLKGRWEGERAGRLLMDETAPDGQELVDTLLNAANAVDRARTRPIGTWHGNGNGGYDLVPPPGTAGYPPVPAGTPVCDLANRGPSRVDFRPDLCCYVYVEVRRCRNCGVMRKAGVAVPDLKTPGVVYDADGAARECARIFSGARLPCPVYGHVPFYNWGGGSGKTAPGDSYTPSAGGGGGIVTSGPGAVITGSGGAGGSGAGTTIHRVPGGVVVVGGGGGGGGGGAPFVIHRAGGGAPCRHGGAVPWGPDRWCPDCGAVYGIR